MREKTGLKEILFKGIIVFTVLMLTALWVTEVFFLEDFYRMIKKREITKACENVTAKLETADLDEDYLRSVCEKYQVCADVCREEDGMNVTLMSCHTLGRCALHSIDAKSKMAIYRATGESGGSYLEYFVYNDEKRYYYSVGEKGLSGDSELTVIYAVTVDTEAGQLLVIFNSVVTPIAATVSTLYLLLGLFTAVILVISAVFGYFLMLKVGKPINELTVRAERLGKEDFRCDVQGYLEIDKLSEALTKASDEIKKTEELRRDFLANVTHDIKTPITLIRGYSEMMLDFPEEKNDENIRNIEREAERISELVGDMLDYSRLVSGTAEPEKEEYSLSEQVREIASRYGELLKKDGAVISVDIKDEATVFADRKMIARVLVNYISNAAFHSGEGEKEICVTLEKTGSDVTVTVIDNGKGIAPEELPRIWDRYYKTGRNNSRGASGSGLGLSIVKEIMEKHGGAYGVRSTLGKGSQFWIILPLAKHRT